MEFIVISFDINISQKQKDVLLTNLCFDSEKAIRANDTNISINSITKRKAKYLSTNFSEENCGWDTKLYRYETGDANQSLSLILVLSKETVNSEVKIELKELKNASDNAVENFKNTMKVMLGTEKKLSKKIKYKDEKRTYIVVNGEGNRGIKIYLKIKRIGKKKALQPEFLIPTIIIILLIAIALIFKNSENPVDANANIFRIWIEDELSTPTSIIALIIQLVTIILALIRGEYTNLTPEQFFIIIEPAPQRITEAQYSDENIEDMCIDGENAQSNSTSIDDKPYEEVEDPLGESNSGGELQ